MKKTVKTALEKEAIIAEYLTGEISFRKLGEKHGIDFRLLHSWVTKFKGNPVRNTTSTKPQASNPETPLSTDVKQLQEELRKAKLYNELLNAIIDIAEDKLKVDIRKKSGTKR